MLLLLFACTTYRDDLQRARTHYDANEYDKALVLLEAIEHDLDSLSEAERAQYDYVRGMSAFRLDDKREARHWLANAAAREKAAQGSLTPDEAKRTGETLAKLNAPYWGDAPAADESSPAEAHAQCKTDLDCVRGQFCDAGTCKKTGEPAAEEHSGSPAAGGDAGQMPAVPKKKGGEQGPSCALDSDCPGKLICARGACVAPKR